jgi:hypothetical protein
MNSEQGGLWGHKLRLEMHFDGQFFSLLLE